VPRVLRFFISGFFGIILPELRIDPQPESTTQTKAWGLLHMSYGPPWAHCLGGYQDRLLGGPLGLPGLRYMASNGVEHKDYKGVVLG
jgi:hypothetical protein